MTLVRAHGNQFDGASAWTEGERTVLADDADWPFVCCLTHDVDRVSHRLPTLQRVVTDPDPESVRRLVGSERPYWRFDEVLEVERELGVTSSFYFLNEKRLFADKGPEHWIRPASWSLYSYYDITDREIREVIAELTDSSWEVGLHGSYESFEDRDRLAYEKSVLESITGASVLGGRQHYLNATLPETWRYQREIGLQYDSTLGSGTEFGFQYGYDVLHPFADDFAVFPLSVMDQALMESADSLRTIHESVDELLREAQEESAIITVDWHQRTFDRVDFPGYRKIYEYFVSRALKMGAWVGPIGDAYELLIENEVGKCVESRQTPL